MSFVIPDPRWEDPCLLVPGKKPVSPVVIDWGHPMTSRLCFFDLCGEREMVTGERPTTDNTVAHGTAKGKGIKCEYGQVNREYARPFMKTSTGDGLGDYTIAVICNPDPDTGTESEHCIAQKNDGQGSPFEQVALFANTALAVSKREDSGSTHFNFEGSPSAVQIPNSLNGDFSVLIGRRKSSVMFFDIDGVLSTSSSVTLRKVYTPDQYTALGSRGNGSTQSFDQIILVGAMWDRALTNAETYEFARNPYQFLIPA